MHGAVRGRQLTDRRKQGIMAATATINGTELAYIEHGQGPPVVFVHGGVGDYREWDLQVPAFAVSFRTIALSCRGAWPNRKLEANEEITLDTFVEDLAAFITALDLAPVHLVGHSSPGGFGGLLLAHRHPKLLRSVVLLEPPAFPLLGVNIPPTPTQVLRLLARNPRAGIGFIKLGTRGIRPAMKAFDRGDDEGGLRIFMEAVAGHEPVNSIPEQTFQAFVGNVGPFKAQMRAGFPEFGKHDASSVRVPTLLVSGGRTPAALTAVTDRLEELLPDVSRLNIAGASHNMFHSHPVEFNAGVIEFIGQY
jgi:pimeloyl-ACP methyl ester carboxylesterase